MSHHVLFVQSLRGQSSIHVHISMVWGHELIPWLVQRSLSLFTVFVFEAWLDSTRCVIFWRHLQRLVRLWFQVFGLRQISVLVTELPCWVSQRGTILSSDRQLFRSRCCLLLAEIPATESRSLKTILNRIANLWWNSYLARCEWCENLSHFTCPLRAERVHVIA